MSMSHKRLIGTAAIAALAIAGAMFAWRAASDSPEDLAQLSDAEKLEIINGDDADAVAELLEAEEAAAQAEFARRRLERQQALAEIEVQRSEAKERGAAYWDDFDPESIDLTGFDFDIAKVTRSSERRAIIAELPIVTGFNRAGEVEYPRSSFDCNPSRYRKIRGLLDREETTPLPVDQYDVARVSDYLSYRVALEKGDCSCATLTSHPEIAWKVIKVLMNDPTIEQFRGDYAKKEAANILGILMGTALEAEVRLFCGGS